MTIVIHFSTLDDMIAELPSNHIVRVAAMDITESVIANGIRLAGIGVHVCAIVDGSIFSCYLPVRVMQVWGVPGKGDPYADEYRQAWDKAHSLADQVRDYLGSKGVQVRSGIIDLGDVRPMRATWRLSRPAEGEPNE